MTIGRVDWLEISVFTSNEAVEAVCELMMEMGAGGVVIEDPRLLANKEAELGPELIDEPNADMNPHGGAVSGAAALGSIGQPSHVVVKSYVRPEDGKDVVDVLAQRVRGLASFGLDPGPAVVSQRLVREDDWAHAWKDFYTVQRIGAGLVIVPTWRSYESRPNEIVMHIDPGMAFGTGTHPTTRLCLAALERYVSPGARLLDVGTGSGILAIASAMLGARVEACDTDPEAVKVAAANAKLNCVDDRISFSIGTLADVAAGNRHDLIVANIVASTILGLLPSISRFLAPGGVFIASGIIVDRLPEVRRGWDEAGLVVDEVAQSGEWVAIVGRLA